MAHALEPQHRAESDLAVAERRRLEEAHRELCAAVADYEERFIGAPPESGKAEPEYAAVELAEAQARIDGAEDELWRLRDELLSWRRPAWAPRAATVADWFSDEDRVYDAFDEPPHGDPDA